MEGRLGRRQRHSSAGGPNQSCHRYSKRGERKESYHSLSPAPRPLPNVKLRLSGFRRPQFQHGKISRWDRTAGTKGKRFALKHSRIMLHQPVGWTGGQASDIEIDVAQIKKAKSDLYKIISKHTGVEYDRIEKDADRNYWMSSQEAKEYGIIDRVILNKE